MQTTYPQAGYRPKTSRRSSVDFLVIYASVALLTAIALFAVWQFWHTDRVFSGVRVADVLWAGRPAPRPSSALTKN
ncbi:MAG: hypothetical protein R2856_29810 [Caldilineaceae bacterium]